MAGEHATLEDEVDQPQRNEVLRIAALILGGQNSYRADTQGKNLRAIVQSAKDLICEVNAQCATTSGNSPSDSTPLMDDFTPNSTPALSKPPSVSRRKPSNKA